MTPEAQAYDALVRDAQSSVAGNQEMVIVFAAGNAGPDAETVSSPGSAKNVITVGAAENVQAIWRTATRTAGGGPILMRTTPMTSLSSRAAVPARMAVISRISWRRARMSAAGSSRRPPPERTARRTPVIPAPAFRAGVAPSTFPPERAVLYGLREHQPFNALRERRLRAGAPVFHQ